MLKFEKYCSKGVQYTHFIETMCKEKTNQMLVFGFQNCFKKSIGRDKLETNLGSFIVN